MGLGPSLSIRQSQQLVLTPQLTQAIQQQIASGGAVTGGAQTMGGSTTNNMM